MDPLKEICCLPSFIFFLHPLSCPCLFALLFHCLFNLVLEILSLRNVSGYAATKNGDKLVENGWFTPHRAPNASTYRPRADRKRMRADNGALSCLLFSSVNNIYFLVAELRIIVICYLCRSHLITVWVHGSQNVDAGGVDEGLNSLVPQDVLWTQVLGHVDEKLSAQHFVAMHVAHQLDLWLHCSWKRV